MRKSLWLGVVAFVVGTAGLSGTASAAPIVLIPQSPDVASNTINMYYTVSGGVGTFTATGKSASIDLVNLTSDPGDTFTLTAHFTPTGSLSTSVPTIIDGSLTINGKVGANPVTTLLSSTTLTQFGFSTLHADFQFVFSNGSGSLDPLNKNIDVVLHGTTTVTDSDYTNDYFGGNFGSSTAAANGTADSWPVPEPASLSIIGLGGVALLARRRRQA
jgi:hypothetical protein